MNSVTYPIAPYAECKMDRGGPIDREGFKISKDLRHDHTSQKPRLATRPANRLNYREFSHSLPADHRSKKPGVELPKYQSRKSHHRDPPHDPNAIQIFSTPLNTAPPTPTHPR